MIGLDEAGRIDHVAAADGVQDVGDGGAGLDQLGGVGLHLKLGHLAALHHDGRDAGLAVEARFDVVGGHLPDAGLRHRVGGEAVAHDGKAAKVRRLATILAVGGRVGWMRAMAAFTSSRVRYMSTFQVKKRSISAVPRLVMDQT